MARLASSVGGWSASAFFKRKSVNTQPSAFSPPHHAATASPVLALGGRSGCNCLDPSKFSFCTVTRQSKAMGDFSKIPRQFYPSLSSRNREIRLLHLQPGAEAEFNAGLSSLRLIRVHLMKLYRTTGAVVLQASSSMDIKSASPRISNTRSVKCGSARRRECSGWTPSASTNLAS